MIKINLLPPGIFEARVIKRLIVLFTVILIVIVAGCMYYTSRVNAEKEQYASEAVIAEGLRDKANSLKKMKDDELAKIGPINDKLNFMDEVENFNLKYPKLYKALARYTYHKVIYSQLSVTQDGTVTISAYAPSLMDAGRYLLNMYRATDLFSSVSISAVPGYPSDGSGTASGATSGTTAAPSPPPMLPTRNAAFGVSPAVGSSGVSSSPGGAMGGMSAIASGIERSPGKRGGFSFTVTCRLVDPGMVAPPSPDGGAAAGTPGMTPMGGGLIAPTPPPAGS